MNDEPLKKLYKEMAERAEEERKERELNPLSRYSTTELKAELRRRKGKK